MTSRVDRFFVATAPDGRVFGWECRTRELAEHAALQRFGANVTVRELTVVEWRKWRQGR